MISWGNFEQLTKLTQKDEYLSGKITIEEIIIIII